jgi:hypothetical protein
MIRYLACLLLPIFLISCGLFIAPRYEVAEERLRPTLDGFVDSVTGSDYASDFLEARFSGSFSYIMLKFPENDIPLGAQILEARLILYTTPNVPNPGDIALFRIKRAWDKTITWTEVDQPDFFYDTDGTYLFVGNPDDRYEWEIRKVVQNWANGAPNNGILLEGFNTGDQAELHFYSNEVDRHPELYVRYY